jgi:3-methyladenine DNA glycosylase/8-oxoguanine DNA glycosylase
MKQRSIDIAFDLDLRLTLGSGRVDPTGKQAWWTTRTPNGPATAVLEHGGSTIEVSAWGDGADWILERIPALLGIDDRPEELIPAHPLLRDLQKRHRGLRIGRTERVFESIVPAILGQKVATEEARRNQRALTRNHSEPAPGPLDLRLPIAPETLREIPYWELHEIGIERKRANLLRFVAKRSNRLEEIVDMTRDAAYSRLTAIPGVGPWTAALVMGSALGDPDAVPVGDYHLPNTVAWALAKEPRADDQRMLELLEPYRGQRGRVVRLLKAGKIHAPKYGPKTAIRSISQI